MRSFLPAILILFMALLLAAGCTGQQPAVPSPAPTATPVPVPTTAAPLPVPVQFLGHWTLTTFGIQDGHAVTYPSTEITLILNDDGSLSGYSGCNNYFGSFAMTGVSTPMGEGMTVSDLGSTKKYCQVYAEQEQQYLSILGKTAAASGDGNRFTLTASTGDSLGFKRP